jgi:deltex-like protein
MSWRLDSGLRLPGFPGSFTIVMQFRFPAGRDAAGQQYRGRSQQAYLPHDESGKLLLELFRLAFRRRVLFDLRTSTSHDSKYWPAFNIHLKTSIAGGPERFGFPDEGYFQRVMQELRENGVTVAELN